MSSQALAATAAAVIAADAGPTLQLLHRKGEWQAEFLSTTISIRSPPDAEGGQHSSAVRSLACMVFQYDLRQGLATADAPLFCAAIDSSQLHHVAAKRRVEAEGSSDNFSSSPLVVEVACLGGLPDDVSLEACREAGIITSTSMLQLPTPVLLIILARFLPTISPSSSVLQLARTCSSLASFVRSGAFWIAALEMRYRLVPCVRSLVECCGAASTSHEYSVPVGLDAAAPSGQPDYFLVPAPPLCVEEMGAIGLDGPGFGVGPGQSLVDAARNYWQSMRMLDTNASSPGGLPKQAMSVPQFPASPLPVVLLAMTEQGPSVVLLESVRAGTPVLEFMGEVTPLDTSHRSRSYFGGPHEVWVDMLETTRTPETSCERRRLCVSAVHRGNEARWLRFCRPGEAPTLRLEVVLSCPGECPSMNASYPEEFIPRLVFVADSDLSPFTELTWIDLHFCSSPLVRARALSETSVDRETRTVPALQDLEHLADMLRAQKRAGAFPGAEGAHVFVAL